MTVDAEFDAWMAAVDAAVQDITGCVSVHDLSDQPFAAWYRDEMSPREAAKLTLEDNDWPL